MFGFLSALSQTLITLPWKILPLPLYVTEIGVWPDHGNNFAQGIYSTQASYKRPPRQLGFAGSPSSGQGTQPSLGTRLPPGPPHRSPPATQVLPWAPSDGFLVPSARPLACVPLLSLGWLEVARGGLGRLGCRRLGGCPYFSLKFSGFYKKRIENAERGDVPVFQPMSLYWKEVPYQVGDVATYLGLTPALLRDLNWGQGLALSGRVEICEQLWPR